MTVPHAPAREVLDQTEPLTVDAAYNRARRAALASSVVGPVGLEIETHIVALDAVDGAVDWESIEAMSASVRAAAGRSVVTHEPGGQLELSAPPAPDIAAAVAELRRDSQRVRLALAEFRLGLAHAGTDPLRPSRRINPRPRYQAMERHFAATGRAAVGAVMMNSTAALQVNLQAGAERDWPERVARAHRIGPVLVAVSACSPWLHGRDTGWKSARQRAWNGLDARACGPVPGAFEPGPAASAAGSRSRSQAGARSGSGSASGAGSGSGSRSRSRAGPRPGAEAGAGAGLDPASAWARYALHAPVAFVQDGGNAAVAVPACVPFERWASGATRLGGRMPTAADLDTHLTTLFPPVRLRGYLELRYLDMTAPRWWPAIAAVATAMMDDPAVADIATEATEQAGGLWAEAARDGLRHPVLAKAARRCLRAAAERAPAALAMAVADLADLVESGRCPGDLLAQRIAEIGPHAAFEELAHV